MLPLESDRWAGLKTFLGDPADIPAAIVRLRNAVGTAGEETAWQTVRDFFLHQFTIKPATAYAVVPYAVAEIRRMEPGRRLSCLVDIGIAEWARLNLPESDVAAKCEPESYSSAVAECRAMAVELVDKAIEPAEFRYLMAAISSLSGHAALASILFRLDGLYGTCPNCGEDGVYPDDLKDSPYV